MNHRYRPGPERRGRAGTGILALLFVSAAGAAAVWAGPPQASSVGVISQAQWARDLDVLAAELPIRHKNLFFRMPEAEFRRAVQVLRSELPSLGEDEILVRLLQIVAAIGDSHTSVGYRPQRGLPLMLYWFKDGIAVQNTTKEYEAILRGRVTAVGGRPLDEVMAAVASVIPHENQSQVKNLAPNVLADTAVLHGLGLIPSAGAASLTVMTESGRAETVEMTPVPFASRPVWLVNTADETGAPLYLKNRNVFYWFEVLVPDRALYFKYNTCREMPGKPFAVFVKELFAAAEAASIERIVVDLRHNGGGDSSIFEPFLEELEKRPAFLQKGKLAVIVGRRTFSSAVLNAFDMKKRTPAVFFGEPTGGKPNHYGELGTLTLPGSGLSVSYSTKYLKVLEDDPDALVPDVPVELASADYLAKQDPVLDATLSRKR